MARTISTVCVLLAMVCCLGVQGNDEHSLLRTLFMNYNKIGAGVARPVADYNSTLNVNFGVALVRLNYYDREREIAEVSLWERYTWNDAFLTWNPDDFGGINHIRIPMTEVYTPDIVLYNNIEQDFRYNENDLGVLYSDGTVLYIPRANRKLQCVENINIESDGFECFLTYGSWTYDGNALDINFYEDREEVDLSDYIVSNKYMLMSHGGRKNVKYYPCCEEAYPDLSFRMAFRLRS